MAYIGPILPLTRDESTGVSSHTSVIENAKQNLKNLLLTNPEERIDPKYGVGLSKYLFENNEPSLIESLKNKIYVQASKYMPEIDILDIEIETFSNNENGINLKITFSVSGVVTTYSI